MMGGLTSDLFIQLTTTLAHLSNITSNKARLGREISNQTLMKGKKHIQPKQGKFYRTFRYYFTITELSSREHSLNSP